MASLREIKDHIGSVRSTLKITSAMKLVASAKLRKAQQAVEGMRPYSEALSEILAAVSGFSAVRMQEGPNCIQGKIAIVGVSSNSSLCGAFNVNVVRKVQELATEFKKQGAGVEVYSVGRKMAEAMRKAGYPSEDYSDLVGKCSFEKASAFAQSLLDAHAQDRYDSIFLVYNHFVSTASQKVQVEQYLGTGGDIAEQMPDSATEEYIVEPSREEVLATLRPQVMRLRLYSVLLDSIAAEHAARTIAMQAASDNAEDLLGTLTLEYNKGRQQKITSEILDLVGGAQQ